MEMCPRKTFLAALLYLRGQAGVGQSFMTLCLCEAMVVYFKALPEKWLTGNLRTDTRLLMPMTAQPILPL